MGMEELPEKTLSEFAWAKKNLCMLAFSGNNFGLGRIIMSEESYAS